MQIRLLVPSSPVSGTVLIEAIPNPDTQVTRVEFRIDGSLRGSDTAAPYRYTWDSTTVSDGVHEIRASVFYGKNKRAEEWTTRTVENVVVPPPPPPAPPPVNTTLPAITPTGAVKEGDMLSCSTGAWTNSPTSYTYQWVRCNASGASCVPIPAATSNRYVLTSADVGSTIRCSVIAHNTYPSGAVQTTQTQVVSALAPAVPDNIAPPVLSGSAVQGSTMGTTNGEWTNAPTDYDYQWERCVSANLVANPGFETDISGWSKGHAASMTLARVTSEHHSGSAAAQVVTDGSVSLQRIYYAAASVRQAGDVVTVRAWVKAASGTIGVRGATIVAGLYKDQGAWVSAAMDGTWKQLEATVTVTASTDQVRIEVGIPSGAAARTFFVDDAEILVPGSGSCSDIASATSPSYVLTADDVGKTVRVGVIARNASGDSAEEFSAVSSPVLSAAIPPPPPPSSALFDGRAVLMTELHRVSSTDYSQSPANFWDGLGFINNDITLEAEPTYTKVYRVRVDDDSCNGNAGNAVCTDPLRSASEVTKRRPYSYAGQVDWYCDAIKVLSTYTCHDWGVILQLNYPSLSSPPVALALSCGSGVSTLHFQVDVSAGRISGLSKQDWDPPSFKHPMDIGPFVDKWVEWVIGVKWALDTSGWIEFYSRTKANGESGFTLRKRYTGLPTAQIVTNYDQPATSLDKMGNYFGYWPGWAGTFPTNQLLHRGLMRFADKASAMAALP